MRKLLGAMGVVMITALAGPAMGVAQADDAAVKQVVKTQEQKYTADGKAFSKASDGLKTKSDVPKLKRATTKLITATKKYRTALLAEQGTTTKVKKARVQLLAALKKLALGLTTFNTALGKIQDGQSREEILGTLGKALDRIEAAGKQGDKAEKALGYVEPDDGGTTET